MPGHKKWSEIHKHQLTIGWQSVSTRPANSKYETNGRECACEQKDK